MVACKLASFGVLEVVACILVSSVVLEVEAVAYKLASFEVLEVEVVAYMLASFEVLEVAAYKWVSPDSSLGLA